MKVEDRLLQKALKVLPYKFIRHYIYPYLIRSDKINYNQQQFWDSYYESAIKQEFSDGATVAHNYDPLTSKYHYNIIENTIIRFLIDYKVLFNQSSKILDIGSGAGHWIEFYNNLIHPQCIYSCEISKPGALQLHRKFKNAPNVKVFQQDISVEDIGSFDNLKVDIVNAIGVMFHLVDDRLWDRAIKNITRNLKQGGYFIIGGQFGLITQKVQFHNQDKFSSWRDYTSYVTLKEIADVARKEVKVNKKIRSLSCWKKAAKRNGLEFVHMYKNTTPINFILPENNLLILKKC